MRADSALALISDAEFRLGQSAIEQAALDERAPSPVIEVIELLRFESVDMHLPVGGGRIAKGRGGNACRLSWESIDAALFTSVRHSSRRNRRTNDAQSWQSVSPYRS